MDKIINDFGIDEKLTKPRRKQKVFNKIKNNIPHIEDYNFMADLIQLPTTKKKHKYLLTIVDLWTDECDFEPLKTKQPKEVLSAMKRIFTRKYLNKPKASISTDGGKEFLGVYHKYLYDNNIFHKQANPNRHTQQANVERLNSQINRVLVGFMNEKENLLKKEWREWDTIIDKLRIKLNNYRKARHTKLKNQGKFKRPIISNIEHKYNTGDIVHYMNDTPEDGLGIQRKPPFRIGDYRFSRNVRKIQHVYYFSDEPNVRYKLEGINNRTFSENQLLPGKGTTSTYIVEKILNKRKYKNKIQYLIKWKGYTKKYNTWENRSSLINDGLKTIIDKFEKK
jgi:hypothetical protein